jgi:hypothetical protein
LVYTVYPHPSNNKVGSEAYKKKILSKVKQHEDSRRGDKKDDDV